jgi:hypothetical protein
MTINYRWLIAGAVLAAALLAVWVMLAAALLGVRVGLSGRSPEPPSPTAHYLKPLHGAVAPWAPRPSPSPTISAILLPEIFNRHPEGPLPKPGIPAG